MSAYKQQMGAEYQKLHPELQKRFDFSTDNNIAVIGKGVMDKIWTGILFPKTGENIAFEIHNYPYKDQGGREVHSMNRIFYFPDGDQFFDGTALFSEKKKHIIEYLGLDHSMVFNQTLRATKDGAILLASGKQYAFIGPFKLPVPSLVRGDVELLQWYDEEKKVFYVDMSVKSKLFGPLFGFTGWFAAEYVDFTGKQLPEKFKPVRFESRE